MAECECFSIQNHGRLLTELCPKCRADLELGRKARAGNWHTNLALISTEAADVRQHGGQGHHCFWRVRLEAMSQMAEAALKAARKGAGK